MYMNGRKMNNYSVIRIGSVLVLAIALVFATFTFPLGTRTGANPISNNPPNVPSNPVPANGSTNVFINVDFNWTGGDPDGDPVTYDIYFGITSPPSKKVANQSALLYHPGTMNYTTHYYWKIIAWDNHSASTVGPQWEFTTKPNAPPNTPSNPSPANGSTDVLASADLSWTGGDPYNDTVTYDVYFGTTSPPSKKVANQSALLYDPGSMNYTTHYYWKIIAWDNHSASTVGPQWTFTTGLKPNTPPNTPSNPSPTNGAANVLLTATLSWTGGDLDGNPVVYDVYFGTTSSPPKVKSNQSTLSYNPGTLSYNTIYYWKIIAWDNHSASTVGPLWHFTTKQAPPMTVIISKPLENTFYFRDQERMSLPTDTIIYGPITITANVTSGIGVTRVEFYVDGKLKETVTAAPYTYLWRPLIQFNGLSLKHTIKVIAYNTE
ncbi:MAG: Ig-like domain-containing protein, partial [Euryarchaeota archaeon]|nr:Ig-like domain-containing protein [Euryarchaeota archaeon]